MGALHTNAVYASKDSKDRINRRIFKETRDHHLAEDPDFGYHWLCLNSNLIRHEVIRRSGDEAEIIHRLAASESMKKCEPPELWVKACRFFRLGEGSSIWTKYTTNGEKSLLTQLQTQSSITGDCWRSESSSH